MKDINHLTDYLIAQSRYITFGYHYYLHAAMPPRLTRSKGSKGFKSASAEDASTSRTTTKKSLETAEDTHRVCVLPKVVSDNAEIIYMPHPSTSAPAAFLFVPKDGRIHELTKVSVPRKTARSWLIAGDENHEEDTKEPAHPLQKGYLIEDADMLIATPFDPLFFLATLLATSRNKDKNSFRLVDDYWEMLSGQSRTFARLVRNELFAKTLLKRLEAISDVQDIGDEKVYRPSQLGMARIMAKKAGRMIGYDVWPVSMDENLVKKELEIPLLQRQHEVDAEQDQECQTENNGNQTGSAKVTRKPKQHNDIDPAVLDRMRMRKALDYLLSAYIPTPLRNDIELLFHQDELKSSTDLLDLTVLNDHLEKVKQAKNEAVALRALSDNISRKRGLDDEETTDARAEKKRKKDEEEMKKKNESRALKNLKKVDTSGMKKMSSFFTKLPAKKEQSA